MVDERRTLLNTICVRRGEIIGHVIQRLLSDLYIYLCRDQAYENNNTITILRRLLFVYE